MKYEVIFGDEKLFDGVCDDAIIVIKNNNSKYVITEHERSDIYHLTLCQPDSFLAMRRIIKTPAWTVADKKAWRFPDVGAKCIYKDNYLVIFTVLYVDDEFICLKSSNGNVFTTLVCDFMKSYKPIETTEERAQRLEDEFIDSIMREHPEITHPISLKVGVRAAYRKLKGGE